MPLNVPPPPPSSSCVLQIRRELEGSQKGCLVLEKQRAFYLTYDLLDQHTQTFYKMLSQWLLSLQDSLSSILIIPHFPRFRDLSFKFYSGLHPVPDKPISHCKTHSPLCSPLSYKQNVSGLGWMLMNFLVCTVAAHSSGRKCPMNADQCAYASSRLVFLLATGTDFLIV